MEKQDKKFVVYYRDLRIENLTGSNIIYAFAKSGRNYGKEKPEIVKIDADGEMIYIDHDLQAKSEGLKKFELLWIGGKTDLLLGTDIADACRKAGIGNGALRVLDSYKEVEIVDPFEAETNEPAKV